MPFVYSTLTCPHNYTNWRLSDDKRKLPAVESVVTIKGGANLANAKQITVLGVRTQVTAEQLECLERNTVFQRHKKKGFITVFNDQEDPETVAKKHMEARDNSAPITPNSEIFKKADETAVKPTEGRGKILGIF